MDDTFAKKLVLYKEWKEILPEIRRKSPDWKLTYVISDFRARLMTINPIVREGHELEDNLRFINRILSSPHGAYRYMFQNDESLAQTPDADLFRSPRGHPGLFIVINDDTLKAFDDVKTRLRELDM
jgi:hypothetical protein